VRPFSEITSSGIVPTRGRTKVEQTPRKEAIHTTHDHDTHPTPFRSVPEDGAPRFPIPLVGAPLLPVLAVARTGLRRVALVVLDRRRRVRFARTLDLRRRAGLGRKLDAVHRIVGRLLDRERIAVLALEAETARSPTPPAFRDLLVRLCDDEAVWMQEREVGSALRAIAGDASKTEVVTEVAAEYRELAVRLHFGGRSLFRDRDHERDARPLVHAFLLAHAVANEARTVSRRTA
jgi:hypothetical protein